EVTCPVSPGTVEVPANGSATVSYTCALASVPTGTVTNTASVSWPAVACPGGLAGALGLLSTLVR
ncbi:MAG: hypothetical protein IPL93_12470, partial [Actinomycetales bacterium]|nr:hypothetical protein [Actinomycetales bacterium]